MQSFIRKISPVLLRSEFLENPEKPCRLIVEMASTQTYRIKDYVEACEGKVHRQMKATPFVVVELPYSALQPMLLSPHIRKIWHDTKVKALLDVAVPSCGVTKARKQELTGKDVTVAVIDTGIALHPDLLRPTNRIVAWQDFVNQRPVPYDDNGHGTHVAGIIAGNGLMSQGKYAGMAPEAHLVGIKALDAEGSGNTSDVISGIEWCIENKEKYNIKAINLSMGSTAEESFREDPLCRVVELAWQNGLVVCVAAGNDGPKPRTINTPGISPRVITVGNLDDHDTEDINDDGISDSSSRGPTLDNLAKPDLLAPGTNIMSLRARGGYRALSGSSMATPMVTGAVALMYQKWPTLKPDQVKMVLRQNARNMGLQPVYEGAGALTMDAMFEEKEKKSSQSFKSLFEILFGKDSALRRLFTSIVPVQEGLFSKEPRKNMIGEAFNPLFSLLFGNYR